MRNTFVSAKLKIICALALVLTASAHALAQSDQQFSINESPLPAPTGFVNDFAGVIDDATKQQLEAKIKAFRDTSSPPTELAVAVVHTTGDRPIFDYSLAVARGWKIGSKETDNPSALLFVAIDDRKFFTQISRDLEDEMPDALAGSLQRQFLVPEFKKGNYAKGISDTIDAYIRTINERRGGAPSGITVSETPAAGTNRPTSSGSLSGGFCCLLIIGLLILIIISKIGRGGGGRRGGGFGGGGGFGSALPWIIGSMIANSGSSSGSSWGGSSGGWGGGDSGGGGFGGFGGGGDFGGGGAGGDW